MLCTGTAIRPQLLSCLSLSRSMGVRVDLVEGIRTINAPNPLKDTSIILRAPIKATALDRSQEEDPNTDVCRGFHMHDGSSLSNSKHIVKFTTSTSTPKVGI